jgi:hypothetical protein
MIRRLPVLSLFSLLILLSLTPDKIKAAPLSARQIIDRAVTTDKRLRESRTAYTYQYKLKTEKLDRKDHILSTEEFKARVRPNKEISYSVEIMEDAATKSAAQKKNQTKQVNEARSLMTKIELEKLAEYYHYEKEGEATLLKRPAHIIRFSPKSSLKAKSREEKVLHALEGRLWIDQENFAILQSEASLSHPVAVAWFFATLRELEFSYQALLLPNGDPAPANFHLFLDVQIPFGYQRQRQHSTMSQYQKTP